MKLDKLSGAVAERREIAEKIDEYAPGYPCLDLLVQRSNFRQDIAYLTPRFLIRWKQWGYSRCRKNHCCLHDSQLAVAK